MAVGEELDRLRHEVSRPNDLLLQHGIEPDGTAHRGADQPGDRGERTA
jgi:hypothetical protein